MRVHPSSFLRSAPPRLVRNSATIISLVFLTACAADRPDPTGPNASLDAVSRNGVPFNEGLASPAWQVTARNLVSQASYAAVQATHVYPILGVAEYLAVQRAEAAIDGAGGRRRLETDRGAVAGASVVTLSYLFPAQAQALEDMVTAQANAGPGQTHPAFAAGEAIGRAVGAEIVARSRVDKFDAPNTATPPAGPGYWTSSANPPLPVAGGNLPGVTPWFMTSADQFRPGPPPAFGGSAFNAALAEIRQISDTRTPRQTEIAAYWALSNGTPTTAGFWLQVASQGIAEHGLSERKATHLYALLSATMFDAQIGCWDAKLTYWLIRPWKADLAISVVAAVGKPNGARPPNVSSTPLERGDDRGSNGVAIAPSNTLSHHALLLINPHTSFFFRAEVQVTSEEGLNAYGAVTWGQFFVYQGFNDRAGWMHSSTGADNIDEYLETVTKRGDHFVYRYGAEERPVAEERAVIRYRTPQGMTQRDFTIYRTHHGPIVRAQNGKWVSVRLMQQPMNALIQSFTRMKARDYKSFRQTMELHTNSSNNTTFADADGDIAYFHSNFIPRRDTSFDWTHPVDGSDSRTEWKGVLSVEETPHLLNPPSGWVYNSNNWPWSAAGAFSPKRSDFPVYVETSKEESPRGRHALMVLPGKKDFTIASLISAAYDPWLPSFARMIPGLLKSYDNLPASDSMRANLAASIAALRAWDYRWATNSIPTSLAVFWGEDLFNRVGAQARQAAMSAETYVIDRATDGERLQSLVAATTKLERDFGSWQTPWGEINRFQRITDDIAPEFDDSAPSIPVPFTSSRWGSLASFAARAYPGTKKWYGTSGNSFVAVIEFGDSVRARAITAGGESGTSSSPHFNDEAQRYSTGNLRDVYFYPSQLKGHIERVYHPGD